MFQVVSRGPLSLYNDDKTPPELVCWNESVLASFDDVELARVFLNAMLKHPNFSPNYPLHIRAIL